ncbi:hypothetical protein RKD27_009197 [Streptomyces sp. SAI-126]|nr:hypothetical protein [Streptomyces sp. SAI-149]
MPESSSLPQCFRGSRLAVPDRMHSLLDVITNIGRGLEPA